MIVTVTDPDVIFFNYPLTQNHCLRKVIMKYYFEKLRISRVISGKESLSFPEILRVQFPSKITKNNSRGIVFVIISCQRVDWK